MVYEFEDKKLGIKYGTPEWVVALAMCEARHRVSWTAQTIAIFAIDSPEEKIQVVDGDNISLRVNREEFDYVLGVTNSNRLGFLKFDNIKSPMTLKEFLSNRDELLKSNKEIMYTTKNPDSTSSIYRGSKDLGEVWAMNKPIEKIKVPTKSLLMAMILAHTPFRRINRYG